VTNITVMNITSTRLISKHPLNPVLSAGSAATCRINEPNGREVRPTNDRVKITLKRNGEINAA
jgi:hypothetical protein